MDMLFIGIIGATVLVISWVYEAMKEIEYHKSYLDLRFSLLHLVGILFLAAYSILVFDTVFMALNVILSVIIIVEIFVALHYIKRHRKSTKKG